MRPFFGVRKQGEKVYTNKTPSLSMDEGEVKLVAASALSSTQDEWNEHLNEIARRIISDLVNVGTCYSFRGNVIIFNEDCSKDTSESFMVLSYLILLITLRQVLYPFLEIKQAQRAWHWDEQGGWGEGLGPQEKLTPT